MRVFSGKVDLCQTGIATPYRDMEGKELCSGDIVVTWSERFPTPGLTVVIAEGDDFFAMGIRSVPLDEPGYWRVSKVKDHVDVIDGEHWRDYGFSFREVANA